MIAGTCVVPAQQSPDTKPNQAQVNARTPQSPNAPSLRIDTDVTSGWSSWGLTGNRNKFRQYATPAHGFDLAELRLAITDLTRNDVRLDFQGVGDDDYRATGLVRLNAGTTKVWAADSRNHFFDPDPSVTQESRRRVSEGYVWQKLLPDFAIQFRSRLDDQREAIAEPIGQLSQTTRTSTISARGSIWRNGFVELGYADTRYVDNTAVLPTTATQSVNAGVSQQFGDSLTLGGSYGHTRISQPGLPVDTIREFGFGGSGVLDRSTNLLVSYRNEGIEMPSVTFAFDRRRQQAKARIVRRLGSGWSLQAGYSQLATERVIDDHTAVGVGRFHTLDFELDGRLSRSSRISAKVSREAMQGAFQMEVLDPRALYWNGRWDARLKVDAHNELANVYLVFDWHQNRNTVRDVTVKNQGLTIGAEWNPKPELEFYSEISTDIWSGRTTDPLSPDLGAFFPDAVTLTLGANWTINAKTWATGNYTFVNSQNGDPLGLAGTSIWGSYFTGTLHYRVGTDHELSLTFAPGQFSDLASPQSGYRTGLVRLTAKARF